MNGRGLRRPDAPWVPATAVDQRDGVTRLTTAVGQRGGVIRSFSNSQKARRLTTLPASSTR